MTGHRLTDQVPGTVEQAYRNAPVGNPDGNPGIEFHFELSDEVPHLDRIGFGPDTADYPTTLQDSKRTWFGDAAEREGEARILKAKRLASTTCSSRTSSRTGGRAGSL